MKNIIALFLILTCMAFASAYTVQSPEPLVVGIVHISVISPEEGYLVNYQVRREFFNSATEVEAFIFKKFIMENDSTLVSDFYHSVLEQKAKTPKVNLGPGKRM